MIKQYYYIQCVFIIILSFFLAVFFNKTCPAASASKDFNIVLITIDTLRADHLSCYGYHRKTSPNIDKIAKKGIVFKNAIAPSSWTVPSMVSLFTSVYPINHGVVHGFFENKKISNQELFSDELTTLTETLKTHGYTTFGVASNLHLDGRLGFARGFDYFKCLPFLSAPHVNKIIYSWKDNIKNSDKFFIWAHYVDPHHPYYPKAPWIEQYISKTSTQKLILSKKRRYELLQLIPMLKKDPQSLAYLIALYDSEINFVDSYIGKLIQKFELDKNTLIIITSDHGEEFLEHDQLDHGNNLHQETIHIPLIIKLPYSTKKEMAEKHVTLLDIMPSILHILDINPPEQTIGKSFWEMEGIISWLKQISQRKGAPNYTFSELDRNNNISKTIMTQKWKYIFNYKNKTEHLFNLKSDPLEKNDLADKNIKQRNKLREQFINWVSHSRKYPTKKKTIQILPQEKEKLKALGYIN